MKEPVKFTDYNGVECFVNESGNFSAMVSGQWFHMSTFDGLKQRIEEERKADAKNAKLALPCYGLIHADNHSYEVVTLTLEGLNRNDSTLKWRERGDKEIVFAVPATEENLELLTDYAKAKAVCDRVLDRITERKLESTRYGGRIQASEYSQRLSNLQYRYKHALKQADAA